MKMENWKDRFVLGITGIMGSGKSTVTKLFEDLGAKRVSSDELARFYTSPETTIKPQLVEILGEEIIDLNGNPDRKKIAEIVFNDKNRLARLNELIHPLVRKDFLDRIYSFQNGEVIAWEAPLLFEAGGNSICNATLTVSANLDDCWKRVEKRDEILVDEFHKRVANQMDIRKKIELSTFSIINEKDISYLKSECSRILKEILDLRIQ